jgi:hypothetical protein
MANFVRCRFPRCAEKLHKGKFGFGFDARGLQMLASTLWMVVPVLISLYGELFISETLDPVFAENDLHLEILSRCLAVLLPPPAAL